MITKQDITKLQKTFATKQDLRDLEQIFVTKRYFDEKLDAFREEMKQLVYGVLDQIVGENRTIQTEHSILHYRVKEHTKQLALHEKRLDSLEVRRS